MRVYDRHASYSLISITLSALFLMVLVLVLFDVFSQLDRYVANSVPLTTITLLSVLYIPEAAGLAIGPAILFATTYVLAMLHANNELIVLLNSGYSRSRMLFPVLATALLLSCALFAFNECISLDASRTKRMLTDEALGIRSQSDNRNVTLRTTDPNFLLQAGRYINDTQRISDVSLVATDTDGNFSKRIHAVSGEYSEGHWILYDATVHELMNEGDVMVKKMPVYDDKRLTLEPGLFRNLGTDIKTMELRSAWQYLVRLKTISASQYPVVATDFYARLFSSLSPFVLSLVACSSVFNWKKNVLVLSIIASLSIAIVYYVLQMVCMIFAKQGVIHPILGPLTPMVVLMFTTPVVARITRK